MSRRAFPDRFDRSSVPWLHWQQTLPLSKDSVHSSTRWIPYVVQYVVPFSPSLVACAGFENNRVLENRKEANPAFAIEQTPNGTVRLFDRQVSALLHCLRVGVCATFADH